MQIDLPECLCNCMVENQYVQERLYTGSLFLIGVWV